MLHNISRYLNLNTFYITIIQVILIVITPLNTIGQTAETDSLIQLLETLPENGERLSVLSDITFNLNHQNADKGILYGRQAIELAKKLDRQKELGDLYRVYAQIIVSINENALLNTKIDSFEYYLNLANEAYESANYRIGKAHLFADRAADEETSGNFENGIKLYLQALDIYKTEGSKSDILYTYIDLAGFFSTMNQLEEAYHYLEISEEDILKLGDQNILAYFLILKGEILTKIGEIDEAFKTYIRLKTIALKEGFYQDVVSSSVELGKIYLERDDFEKAEEQLLSAMDYAYRLNDAYFLIKAQLGISKFYIQTNQSDKAVAELEKAKSHIEDPIYGIFMNEIRKYLAIAYHDIENLDKAYYNLLEYSSLQDSVFESRATKIASEMEAVYQNKEKLILLNQAKKQRNYLYAILGLVALISIFLLWAFRQKLKMTKILSSKNEEKEFLLKEIHHRVKNNLQIISSLLNMQSKSISNDDAAQAVIEGRNRVQSMSLIHQKLYLGDNIAGVNMSEYLTELIEHLLDSFGIENNRIQIIKHIDTPELDVDTAIPLGLIINELLTNSFKFAFPANQDGTIHLELKIQENEVLYLSVSDNGVGNKAVTDLSNSSNFGSSLIDILCKKLKGKPISKSTKNGYKTEVLFKRFEIAQQLS